MIKKARAAYVLQRLQELYPDPPIPLDHKDPYTLLIAVLLSAQCTDVRVNQITPTLFARADTPEAMLTGACGGDSRDHSALWTVADEVEGHRWSVADVGRGSWRRGAC